ncbi:murein biosynthesis integral membrane protein MurJ [Iningainema tapete]|uniref:Murein biosynthesis integral membrane protein MurJ n=1 Tax=Iningainema tapete BLCC-T55 TaxID=2748662 RepID=A0A8J6XI86_9CYAN|nr:murein biosynthesis integral membrane protein MurJ [Iningainema tapete]MBD2773232.1 murein biosynthesis integral membrane protein MurJ [Iningainema tapete BLCC-T55]
MKNRQTQRFFDYWKKLTSGSTNRQILGAAITVGIATALVKVAAVFKELVVAWKFGTADALDAFLIALLVPAFITNVVGGSFNAALIPTYIKVREQEGTKAAQKLFSGVIVLSLALLLITTLFIVMTASLYLPRIATGFSAEKLGLTFQLLWAIAPTVVLSGIITLWSAVLNAGERFALAAVSPIITPAISILFLLLANSWGVFALVAGLVCGAVLEMIVVGAALHRQGISLLPKWYGFDAHQREVANQYLPMIAGACLMCSAGLVDQSMAAMLSPGSVAALNYGNRVTALPINLTTTALSTAVMPYFAKMVGHQDWQSIRHTLKRYMGLVFAITVPLTVLLVVFSEPIIQILFQRGSFTANDTQLVAQIQSCLALQIPFYVANILVVRLISSLQFNQILMWVSGYNLLINVVLNYLLIQWIGIKGIALSTSCVYVFCFFYLLSFIIRKIPKYNNVD